MLTAEALREIHRRTQLGTAQLLAHCAQFSPQQLTQQFEHCGFGYPDLLEQWRHVIGAEDYWVSVLKGNWDIPDRAAACNSVAELEARRVLVAEQTADYLSSVTSDELNSPREFAAWPEGRRRELIPAMVIMRTVTHAFHHRGQIVAICRMLGSPCPPSDFPLSL